MWIGYIQDKDGIVETRSVSTLDKAMALARKIPHKGDHPVAICCRLESSRPPDVNVRRIASLAVNGVTFGDADVRERIKRRTGSIMLSRMR